MKRAFISVAFAVVGVSLSGLHSSPAAAQGNSSGAVSIELLVNGQPADSAPGPTVSVGDVLTLDYVITVGGSEELYDLAVRDTSDAKPNCDTNGDGQPDGFSVHPGPLTAGAVFTCTATVTAAGANGTVAVIATVSATDFDGVGQYDSQNPAHYTPVSPTTTTAPATTTSTPPPTTATSTTTSAPPTSTDDPEATPSSLGFGADGPVDEDGIDTETKDDVNRPIGATTAAVDIEILLDSEHDLRSSSGQRTGERSPMPVVSAETQTDLAWSYVVTNTGDVTLDRIEVVAAETVGDGARRTQTVTCPWEGTGSLPPGRAIRCTASTRGPLTPGPLTVSATVRAIPTDGDIDTDGGPVEAIAEFEVLTEGSDGVAFADETPLLFGFGIAFALLAATSLVLWLLPDKPDLEHELP